MSLISSEKVSRLLETRECENPKCWAKFRVLPTDNQKYCGQQCSFERRKVKRAGDRYRQTVLGREVH